MQHYTVKNVQYTNIMIMSALTDGDFVIKSGLRMDLISSKLNKMTHLKLSCVKSTDPGR